jgi:CheY-like chemotaxis protein
MMPGIGGYETCTRLKANETTQNAVIIFLTADRMSTQSVVGFS